MRLDTLFFEACARFGNATALEDAEQCLSYAALAQAAHAIADDLRGQGLHADEPVLVAVASTPHDIAAFLGVWTADGVVVPVARNAPAAVTEATRATTGARFVVTGANVERLADRAPRPRPLLAGAAIIIFTSGSTGAPKGVVLGHAGFAANLAEIDSALGFSPETRALLVLQITFVFGIWVTLLTLMKGGGVFMAQRFDPAAVMADIGERQITDAAFVPTMLRRLVAADTAPGRLKRVHTGGEPFSSALGQRLQKIFPEAEIIDIYGLTETASSDFFVFTKRGAAFTGGIGRISKSERFRIADAEGNEVPAGQPGELQIRTPFIMNGYLDAPELTRAACCGEYFRTGDLARVGPDGTVELVGRAKDLILRAGAKISPLELDGLIAQHPAVAAALTVGVNDAIVGERIHVLVVPQASQTVDEPELRAWIAQRVERYKRPDVYHSGNELPTGRTGKVDRDALRRSITGEA
jgi:acyl-CoA synthetase (AMP-forming)/AMP-acid ligase II